MTYGFYPTVVAALRAQSHAEDHRGAGGLCRDAADEIERLQTALRYGCGAAINSLPPGEREWSPESGIGVMLAALGCNAVVYGDDVRAALSA